MSISVGRLTRFTLIASSSPSPSPVRLSPWCSMAPSGLLRLLKKTKWPSDNTLPSARHAIALASRSKSAPVVLRASQPRPTTMLARPGASLVSETFPPLLRLTPTAPPAVIAIGAVLVPRVFQRPGRPPHRARRSLLDSITHAHGDMGSPGPVFSGTNGTTRGFPSRQLSTPGRRGPVAPPRGPPPREHGRRGYLRPETDGEPVHPWQQAYPERSSTWRLRSDADILLARRTASVSPTQPHPVAPRCSRWGATSRYKRGGVSRGGSPR